MIAYWSLINYVIANNNIIIYYIKQLYLNSDINKLYTCKINNYIILLINNNYYCIIILYWKSSKNVTWVINKK